MAVINTKCGYIDNCNGK